MIVNLKDLEILVDKALSKQGYDAQESKVIKNILLYAQLRGNNQGVVKLIGAGIPKNKDAKLPKIVKETPVSALFDNRGTFGMIVMDKMTDVAIAKAKKTGVAIVGNFNSEGSTGAIGYYVLKIAKEGLIGMAFASAPFQTTAPFGSSEARFCTNPIAYGIPTETEPIVLDMTTSAMARYGLIEAKNAGKQVSEGAGYDKNGNPSTDPAEIMAGALKTFGGHKGSGLALVVQILAGALVRAESFNSESENSGNLVIAIDPNILTPKEDFVKEVSSIVSRVKTAKKLKGVTEITIPGEKSARFNKEVLESGEIEMEDNLYNELKKAASQ